MKMPWHKRAEHARAAAEKARDDYEQVLSQRVQVDNISRMVREQRELNHFADAFRQIMGD